MSFSPEEIADSIKKYIPDFVIEYDVDPVRQSIADSWPNSLDSSSAVKEWNFKFSYDLDKMTKDMLEKFQKRNRQITTYHFYQNRQYTPSSM